jgi:predicted negative regulator of RcsB-dependent stress response
MAQRRFRRKDLKRPDEFVTRGRRLIVWVRANTSRVYQVAGAFVIVLVVVGAFYSLRTARQRQANDDFAQALAPLRAGDYSAASNQLAEVAARWQSTGAGQAAKLLAAGAALRANNHATVAALLADIPDTAPAYLRQQALVTLGFSLEQQGALTEAAQRYAEAAAIAGPYGAVALLGQARCQEHLGDRDAARGLYERLTREFPEAGEAERLEAKIAQLQG